MGAMWFHADLIHDRETRFGAHFLHEIDSNSNNG